MSSPKKPCSVCGRWFFPDPRVGARQRTCGAACSAARRRRVQAAWREGHPDYWSAARVRAEAERLMASMGRSPQSDVAPRPTAPSAPRDPVPAGPAAALASGTSQSARALASVAASAATRPPAPLRAHPPPSDIARVPWDMVQSEFGTQGAVLLMFFARVLHRASQSEMRAQVAVLQRESARHLVLGSQSETDLRIAPRDSPDHPPGRQGGGETEVGT